MRYHCPQVAVPSTNVFLTISRAPKTITLTKVLFTAFSIGVGVSNSYCSVAHPRATSFAGGTATCANDRSSTTTHLGQCEMPTISVTPTVTDTNIDASTTSRQLTSARPNVNCQRQAAMSRRSATRARSSQGSLPVSPLSDFVA
ncbi:hypothetical protein CTI12_AA481360 [Artemisia annua]|uniref:Uncharacterized protein n=1 Tax=Artemisia annua TaxID=35608 RepID=A0A2U1LKP9_ARTAN|nr:hypothetical protein CTI12_AA481360 [Artemisia annua]